jgi:hypothetical protein
MTVGVARNGDGLRRKERSGTDEREKFFGSLFFKKGTACFLAGASARRTSGNKIRHKSQVFLVFNKEQYFLCSSYRK